ncbi:MAG TPA: glucuronyl hydrolase [Verrucomicrobiae bacterium]|nr:glucuronyl hydrolase [Verrucomicrobiae bacterium]
MLNFIAATTRCRTVSIPKLSGLALIIGIFSFVLSGCSGSKATRTDAAGISAGDRDELLARLPETFRFAGSQYDRMLARLTNGPMFPRSYENGRHRLVNARDWTSGFFPGALWYLYDYTRDPKWLHAASNYTARLSSIQNFRGHHDVGFMLYCSYGNGLRLTGEASYQPVLLRGAESLASRFKPEVGLIRSWDFGGWSCPVIIDNMMNLELLMWAARNGGDSRLREIALSHADRTLKNHFRADYSSFHLVDYNPANGTILGKQTVQGFADHTAWARGQAWGLYGFTMMARETGRADYLAHATNIANFLVNHPRMPADKIPYWDFDAPNIPNEPRDASAGAIMSSALIELSRLVGGGAGKRYFEVARQQLLSLSSPAYRADVEKDGDFILRHSVGHIPEKHEIDVPIVYADYYFLEALLRYRDRVTAR